jgi:hypothetical protein
MFDKDNRIFYGQDFRYAFGVPSGIDFEITKVDGNILTLAITGMAIL